MLSELEPIANANKGGHEDLSILNNEILDQIEREAYGHRKYLKDLGITNGFGFIDQKKADKLLKTFKSKCNKMDIDNIKLRIPQIINDYIRNGLMPCLKAKNIHELIKDIEDSFPKFEKDKTKLELLRKGKLIDLLEELEEIFEEEEEELSLTAPIEKDSNRFLITVQNHGIIVVDDQTMTDFITAEGEGIFF